jgi:sulfatase maturation enzyme AslB (radical SAM superfamily)
MNETACAAFWVHTNIRAGNKVYACCRYKEPIQQFDGNVEGTLLSTEYNKLRQDSLHNVKNSNCSKCYYEETIGKESLRQWFNKSYGLSSVELKYIEIGFDNICNLTCDGCWEQWSSSWWVKKNPEGIPKQGIISTDEFVSIPNTIEYIVFLGGEPLMTNRHEKLLQSMSEKEKIKVRYVTNGTFLLKDSTIEQLKQYKEVEFVVSIDGFAELNDAVRSGSNWNDILLFLDQLVYNKFNVIINTTIHKNNWQGLRDLKEFVEKYNFEWMTNFLTYPQHLDIRNLENKDDVINFFETFDFPNKPSTLQHLKEPYVRIQVQHR